MLDPTAATNILKRVYGPRLPRLLPDTVPLMKHIDMRQEPVEGADFRVPFTYQRNETGGYHAEGAAISGFGAGEDIGNEAEDVWVITPTRYDAAAEVTEEAIGRMRSNRGSFARPLAKEMKGVMSTYREIKEESLWGTGWGDLARVDQATPSGSTTVTMDDDIPTGDRGQGVRNLRPGMYVEFWSAQGTAGVRRSTTGVRKISSISKASSNVVLASVTSTDVVNNDFVFRARSRKTDSAVVSHAPMGIQGHLDSESLWTTYQGITRTTYTQADAQIFEEANNALRPIDRDLMQIAVDSVDDEANAEFNGVDIIFFNRATRRSWVKKLEEFIRFQPLSQDKAGQPARLMYHGGARAIPMEVARKCPLEKIYGLTSKSFHWLWERKFGWLDQDGQILHKRQGYANWLAEAMELGNLFCEAPYQNFVIADVDYTLS